MKKRSFQQIVARRPHTLFVMIAAIAMLSAVGPRSVTAMTYTFVDLGVPSSSEPNINNANQVVSSQFDLFLYTPGTGWSDLGQPASAQYSYAWTLNQNGDIAGLSVFPSNQYRATLYTASTGYTVIPTLGGSLSWPHGINDSDIVVGYSETASYPNFGPTYGYWFQNGAMHAIPSIGGSTISNYATGINDSGLVCGYANAPGATRGYTFDINSSTLTDLGVPAGYYSSIPLCINASGEIGGFLSGSGHNYPAIYSNGSWTNLGLGPLGVSGQISGINSSGDAVGDEFDQDPTTGNSFNVPMLYHNGVGIDLNTVTTFPSPGITIQDVNGINDKGYITGVTYINNQNHVYMPRPRRSPACRSRRRSR